MKKLSQTILIRTDSENSFNAIQTDKDFTFCEKVDHRGFLEKFEVCVDTEKFITTYSDDLVFSIDRGFKMSNPDGTFEVELPIMKEFGEFTMFPEIVPKGALLKSYEEDYSNKDLDLAEASGQFSFVMIGEGFACRYLYNTLDYYGDSLRTEYYSLLPKQYKLLQSLGTCKIDVFEDCLSASNGKIKLILPIFRPVLNLQLIERFFRIEPLMTFASPEIRFKEMKVLSKNVETFSLDISGKKKTFTISLDGYHREYPIEVESDIEISSIFWIKDLDHFTGSLKLCKIGNFLYIIKTEEDHTVLFSGKEK